MYRLGLYEKAMPGSLSLPEKLGAAKSLGFDFLELSVDESDGKLARLDMSRGAREELMRAMARENFYLESMCLSGHRRFPLGSADAAIRARGLEILEKAVLLARDLGIRIIQLAGYDVYYEPSTEQTRANFAENLARSCQIAAQYGVTLAFETMETDFLNTVEKAMAHVRRVNSPYLGVYPDVGNLTNACGRNDDAVSAEIACGHDFAAEELKRRDIVSDIACGHGHIVAAHLKETRPGIFREVRFGEGHVDFAAAIGALKTAGVRKFLAEMWDVGGDWRTEVAEANAFLRGYLEAAFEGEKR